MKMYSFKKGFGKAVGSALTILMAFVVFAGISDFQIWDLLEQHLRPILGSMTVGGVITLIRNFVKFHTQENA